MGIVYITSYGKSQMPFICALNKATNGGVALVIFEKPRPRKLAGRLRRVAAAARSGKLLRELWYGMLLRLNPRTSALLDYFREQPAPDAVVDEPASLEVDDLNGEEVRAALEKISPTLLMTYGCSILKPHILETATCAINLHRGISPYYRGAIANEYAVLRRDKRIGNTIHFITNDVDRGGIIAQIQADTSKRPREMFRDLHAATQSEFIAIAKKILAGEDIPVQPQSGEKGEFFSLNQWTNEARYRVISQIARWESTGKF